MGAEQRRRQPGGVGDVEAWHEAFEEYEVQVCEYLGRGDYVIVVGRVVGRGRTSGVEVADDDAWLFRFRDGKAIEYRECKTKAAALEAAGLEE